MYLVEGTEEASGALMLPPAPAVGRASILCVHLLALAAAEGGEKLRFCCATPMACVFWAVRKRDRRGRRGLPHGWPVP